MIKTKTISKSLTLFLIFIGLTACAKEPEMQAKTDSIVLGMGCFWGAEKRMAALPGVIDVESGYANGAIAANYDAILQHERLLRAGKTDLRNHAEVIKVSYDPTQTSLENVLIQFWQNHNPTQGDRQGNDIGSNYRSAIYYQTDQEASIAQATAERYQQTLTQAGFGKITTEIARLTNYSAAEDYHQDYLVKNPNGYCGLGGTGVPYPELGTPKTAQQPNYQNLNKNNQLIVFTSENCGFCDAFKRDILANWQASVEIQSTEIPLPPEGWQLAKPLFATPTIVYFKDQKEQSRYTGYQGNPTEFWKWLGFQLLTPQQQQIAFEQGTERAFTGSHLDEKRPGVFVDPITGAQLFRTDTKFDSGSGWPSFFNPIEGALTYHTDKSHGMERTEVRSASSGIHLGHVFNDGPPPTYKRYCINGNVLKFIAD
jgi:peptide methionine sulfoxide reductase msrA/msrB